ncbi:centrosome-associated protein CEP250 isoform X1 [Latimeria chalumnae]|uniref:centrosome-associated protein CEP250 isoform X1 n=1 Tax=Latimeria chalumnae TaxID=7897 RepID=UPI00313D3B5C
MNEVCRVCSSKLKGNQRRWLFGPGGSINIQVVLEHVLGHEVTRDGRSEFLCGKCVFVLEHVFRFDTVITRVQAMSIEKLQRLMVEKDKLAQLLRRFYAQTHRRLPAALPSYRGQEITVDIAGLPHVRYNALLQEDMALSEYECWSERNADAANGCEGRGCKNRNCYSCNALKVSDSDYESICKVPRRLARRMNRDSLYQLSKSKSRSMPLDFLLTPERSRSVSSFSSSAHSLCTDSIERGSQSFSTTSLDTIADSEADPFDQLLASTPAVLAMAISEIRHIEYHPVHSPPSCKIPVRVSRGRSPGFSAPTTPRGHLHFDCGDDNFRELKWESPDEYLPLTQEKFREWQLKEEKMKRAIQRLQEQLEMAQAQVRALQEKRPETHHTNEVSGTVREEEKQPSTRDSDRQERRVAQLVESLHRKEVLLQDLFDAMEQLKRGGSPAVATDSMIHKLRQQLKERDKALEAAADEKFRAMEEKEEEILQLRLALREKDRDVSRLAEVLRYNEETISALSDVIGQKDMALQRLEEACCSLQGAARGWDETQLRTLREKDELIASLQGALASCSKDMEALKDSLIGQGLSDNAGGGANRLALQLWEKERTVARVLSDWNQQAVAHQKEVENLLESLASKEKTIQENSDLFTRSLDAKSREASDLRRQLLAKELELGNRVKLETSAEQDRLGEIACLRVSLEQRERMIARFLEEAQEKDRLLMKIQEDFRDVLSPGGKKIKKTDALAFGHSAVVDGKKLNSAMTWPSSTRREEEEEESRLSIENTI